MYCPGCVHPCSILNLHSATRQKEPKGGGPVAPLPPPPDVPKQTRVGHFSAATHPHHLPLPFAAIGTRDVRFRTCKGRGRGKGDTGVGRGREEAFGRFEGSEQRKASSTTVARYEHADGARVSCQALECESCVCVCVLSPALTCSARSL